MSKPIRLLSCVGSAVLVSVVLASCGGGLPADAVVQVGSSPITKDTFNHWMGIAAASATASTTSSTAAKAPVPEPPDYTACIAHLRATAAKPAKGKSAPSTAKLKSECEQEYSSYKSEVLGYLISSEWFLDEAAELHIKVSEKQVEQEFAKAKKEEFATEASFKAFLQKTGFTVSDLELRIKVEDMLAPKIEKKATSEAKPVTEAQIASFYEQHRSSYAKESPSKAQSAIKKLLTATASSAALDAFFKRFQTKWKAKTNCATGYIVSDCKQYKTETTSSTTT